MDIEHKANALTLSEWKKNGRIFKAHAAEEFRGVGTKGTWRDMPKRPSRLKFCANGADEVVPRYVKMQTYVVCDRPADQRFRIRP